jgi:uncharacterized protein
VNSGLDFDFNYVRNSVKATVDAYDGSIKFYVVDPTDPIIRTYRKAFPGLFSDEQPSEELRAHFRYPQDLFSTQTEHFALYHISDPTEYFNKQDIWDVTPTPGTTSTESNSVAAQQQGNNGGRNTTLPPSGSPALPLYLTLQLPGQEQPEFVLQRSFTPRTRSGILTSFIMARSDGDHYGELMLYNVSGAEAPSPFKAASAIDSDAFISQQLSLLDRAGSKVKPKGQEQLIPIGDAIMYVRPIWIEASEPPYPRFRFVAAVTGDRAVMGYDVDDVKTALLGPRGTQTRLQRDVNGGRSITDLANQPTNGTNNSNGSTTTTTTTPPNTTPGSTLPPGNQTAEQLLALAQREFDQAQAALEAGNLGEYQRHVAAAQAAVNSAAGKITASTTTP